MYNRLVTLYQNASHTTRIEFFLCSFTVLVFILVTFSVGYLDSKALAPYQEFSYPVVHSDSEMYAQLADRMLSLGVYSTSDNPPYEPEINWAPGYPLLLAFSFAVFGSIVPVVLLQIFLAGVVSVLIFRITRRFTPLYIALIPAIAFTLDISIAYYSSTVHTDGLFMALITLLVYILFFTEETRRSVPMLFALGLLLGFSALVRTIAQYLIVVIPVMYLLHIFIRGEEKKRALIGMVSFVFGFILVVTPWAIRNHEVLGAYSLGNIGPKMFLQYYVKDFLTVKAGGTGDYAQSDIANEISNQIERELESIVEKKGGIPEAHYQELAISHILADPIAYGRFHTIGTLPYFLAGSYRHFFVSVLEPYKERAGIPAREHVNIAHNMTAVLYSGSMSEIVTAVKELSFVLIEIAWRVLLILLGLCALCIPDKKNKYIMLVLWGLVCYFAFLTGPSALTRYRIVSEPLLLSLAGVGGWILYTYLKNYIVRFNQKSI